MRRGWKLVGTNVCRKQPQCGQIHYLHPLRLGSRGPQSRLSTSTVPLGPPLPPTLPTFPRMQDLRPKRDASPINHFCTPIILGETQKRQDSAALTGQVPLAASSPIALIAGLCIIAHNSRLPNSGCHCPTVKRQNAQHLLSGSPVPGVRRLVKRCLNPILNRSVCHLNWNLLYQAFRERKAGD